MAPSSLPSKISAVARLRPLRYSGRNAPVAQLDRALPSEGFRKSSSKSAPERAFQAFSNFLYAPKHVTAHAGHINLNIDAHEFVLKVADESRLAQLGW